MLGWLKFAGVVGCLWGNAAFATLPDVVGGERQELQSISSWISQINANFVPTLHVGTTEDVTDPVVRDQVRKELFLLESVFRGEDRLPAGSLMFISCDSAVCGGSGDPGRCMKCSVPR